jgi:hypothetical protein
MALTLNFISDKLLFIKLFQLIFQLVRVLSMLVVALNNKKLISEKPFKDTQYIKRDSCSSKVHSLNFII